MTDHHALPHVPGVGCSCGFGFRANRSWVQQNFCPLQRHSSSRFWIPLIPADTRTNIPCTGWEGFEARVTGVKVIFFGVPRTIWNVGFAVQTQQFAARVNHGKRVKIGMVGSFKKRDWQDHIQFFCQRLKLWNKWMLLERIGKRKILFALDLTPIQVLEEFWQQDQVCSSSHSITNKRNCFFNILISITGHGHLNDSQFSLHEHSSRSPK